MCAIKTWNSRKFKSSENEPISNDVVDFVIFRHSFRRSIYHHHFAHTCVSSSRCTTIKQDTNSSIHSQRNQLGQKIKMKNTAQDNGKIWKCCARARDSSISLLIVFSCYYFLFFVDSLRENVFIVMIVSEKKRKTLRRLMLMRKKNETLVSVNCRRFFNYCSYITIR